MRIPNSTFPLLLSLLSIGCSDDPLAEQSSGPSDSSMDTGGGTSNGGGGSSSGAQGTEDEPGAGGSGDADPSTSGGSFSIPVIGPDSRDIPQFGEPGFDPSVDPGVHPTFIDDPFFSQDDLYVYTPTQSGTHDLPEGIVAIDYDVAGDADLRAVLTSHLTALESGYGLALYLINGTALSDEDLFFLQMLNTPDNGLGLTNLDTLHVYNLRTLQGGVESTTETVYGNPYPMIWYNGWQGPDSEVAQGEGGWVKHIVMDDLEEIAEGAFCDTMFETMSFKGAKVVRRMGFGFRPRAKAEEIYLPSVELIETHAFRRGQYLLKVHLPRVTVIEDFAFDDNSRLEYFSAPQLEWIGRNGLNDTHELIAVHLPALEYVGINCFDLQYQLTTLRLPALTEVRDNGLEGFEVLTFAYLPQVEDLNSRSMINCFELEAVYLGEVPPAYGTDVFTNTSDNLTVYYSGDDPGWSEWVPVGNESAPLVQF